VPERILPGGSKRVLIVLFIPSVERDGKTTVDQTFWAEEALKMFGEAFGGATAYPKARGVWRDTERGGTLVFDDTVVVHCYTTPKDVQSASKMKKVAAFCERMRVEARQGEVGLVIADEYFAFRNFKETTR
jgi:hypothetical protein